ncbi:MAG: ATP-binding cassette domain-containing protein [Acidimicrobiales bacterium]
MSAASLRIDDLHHRYGGRHALRALTLSALGGVVAVLGPNGAGKSTMLRSVATVQRATSGAIYIDGLDVRVEPDRTEARRRLGYLPQDPHFAPRATVFDVVDYLAICKEHNDRRSRHREVRRVLDIMGLSDRAEDRVKTLSGGMIRRLGLAQALLGSPRLLVLDEPGAGLDPDQRLELRDLLSRIGSAATVLISTHMIEEAAVIASQVVVIADGRVRFSGTAAGLTSRAAGCVWHAADPPVRAVRFWRRPDGTHRCIGRPPPGAALVEPTMEDGYLLLVSGGADPA